MARKKVSTVEETVRNIRRKTRKKYSGEEKIRILLERLRGEQSVAGPFLIPFLTSQS
jgi:transposase